MHHQLSKFALNLIFTSIFLLAVIPFAWPALSDQEGKLFPVLSTLEIVSYDKQPEGVYLYVEFAKLRQCEFIQMVWYRGNAIIPLITRPDDPSTIPITRPVGEAVSGPWLLETFSLQGTNAIVQHRCHPLWYTYTNFYP